MKFNSLGAALRYRETCPYCKNNLEVARIPKSTAHPTVMNNRMYWREPITNEFISVDLDTEEMEISSKDRTQGTYYCALKITCELCDSYYHVFNLKFNLTNRTIECIEINNQGVEFCDSDYEYSITNSKSFEKIALIKRYIKTGDEKIIEFPYMDIDIENPVNTLKRLEGLIAYL
jgi:hypothetical protein